MDGHVRKRGDKWYYGFEIPGQDEKRKRIERVGGKTKKEAQNALIVALAEYKNSGKMYLNSKYSFDTVFNDFISNEAEFSRKFSTIKRFKSIYKNHFSDAFGSKLISSITAEHIQSFLSSKKDTHSIEYIRSMNNVLFVIFDYAHRMDKIRSNPMHNVRAPKKPTENNDIKFYTDEQLKILSERLLSTNLHMAFQIGINLGVRAGECYALRWSDFDIDECTVKIDKQLQHYNGSWCFTTLKTQNSYRTIKFSENFRNYLLQQLKKVEMAKNQYGKMYKSNIVMDSIAGDVITVDDFVNVKTNGEMLNTYSHKVISRIAKNEFGIDFKYHNLRHTHATILLEGGLNPKYIQERLGHAKLEFTLKLYTHITNSMNDEAAKLLNSKLEI